MMSRDFFTRTGDANLAECLCATAKSPNLRNDLHGRGPAMTNPSGHEDFVDLIYQAAIDTELWPEVLERLVDLIDGEAATLHWYDLFSNVSVGVGVRVDQVALDRAFAEFAHCNPLTDQNPTLKVERLRNFVPKIRRDVDWLPKEQFLRTAYYNDFFQSFGFHSDVGLGVMVEDMGDGVFEGAGINVFRHKRMDHWTDDNMALSAAVHPHLIRAYKLGRRIAARQQVGESLTEFLDRAPYGLFLLNGRGRVGHINPAGQALLEEDDGLTVIAGQLAARRPEDARRLQHLIAQAASADREQRSGGTMALATRTRLRPLSVMIAPIRGERAALFPSGPSVVVCVTDLDATVTLPERQLRDLFGLTPAEGRVALALSEGLDPASVAKHLGVALPTVRSHLAHIFEKTGAGGQVALTSLMTRAAGPPLGQGDR
jgi:DNA-binding CsgD family transcriptional regulator